MATEKPVSKLRKLLNETITGVTIAGASVLGADPASAQKPASQPASASAPVEEKEVSQKEWLAILKAGSIAELDALGKKLAQQADERIAAIIKAGDTPTIEQQADAALMKNDPAALKSALGKMDADQKKDYLERGYQGVTPKGYARPMPPLVALVGGGPFADRDSALIRERFGILPVAQVLLEAGAEPNPVGSDQTPLCHKVQDIDMLKLMQKHGADLAAVDGYDRNSLFSNAVESVGFHKRSGAYVEPTYYINPRLLDDEVPGSQSIAKMKFLINEVKFEPKNQLALPERGSADHVMGNLYDAERTKLLIEHGGEHQVNAKFYDDNRPLHRCWHLESAKLLVAAGADLSARNEAGLTPRETLKQVYEKRRNSEIYYPMSRITPLEKKHLTEAELALRAELGEVVKFLEREELKQKGGHVEKQEGRRQQPRSTVPQK